MRKLQMHLVPKADFCLCRLPPSFWLLSAACYTWDTYLIQHCLHYLSNGWSPSGKYTSKLFVLCISLASMLGCDSVMMLLLGWKATHFTKSELPLALRPFCQDGNNGVVGTNGEALIC